MTDEQAERMIALLERIAAALEKQSQPVINNTFVEPPSKNDIARLQTEVLREMQKLGIRPSEIIGKPLPPSDDDDPLTWRMNTGG